MTCDDDLKLLIVLCPSKMNLASKIIYFFKSYAEYSALTGACSWPLIKDAVDQKY